MSSKSVVLHELGGDLSREFDLYTAICVNLRQLFKFGLWGFLERLPLSL